MPSPLTSFHRLRGSSLPSWGLLTLLTDPAVAWESGCSGSGQGWESLRRACLSGWAAWDASAHAGRCVSSARSQDQLYRHNILNQ